MREDPARDVIKDTRVENLNAGEHQRLRARDSIKRRSWHSGESGDQAIISLDDTELFAVPILEQHECRQRVLSLVLFDSRVQINICNDLSVDYDECVAFQEVARVVHSAAGAEDHRLMNVFQLNAKLTAIAQRALN